MTVRSVDRIHFKAPGNVAWHALIGHALDGDEKFDPTQLFANNTIFQKVWSGLGQTFFLLRVRSIVPKSL